MHKFEKISLYTSTMLHFFVQHAYMYKLISTCILIQIPVVNLRYQRTQNADRWIDHRPTGIVPTGTILQPRTQPHKRTIRKLTNPKDFVTRSSRYCLLSQEQDADGDLETKLYKVIIQGPFQFNFTSENCIFLLSLHVAGRCIADLWRRGADSI